MAEALLRQFVARIFGDYVTERSLQRAIPSGGFATAIFQGSLQFRDDLELKPNILERLGIDVPFTLARGVLSAVYVNIPYGNIATRTSSVSIGGVSLLLRTTALDAEDHPALSRAIDKGKEAAVAAAVERTRKALAQALTDSIKRAAVGGAASSDGVLPSAGVLGWAGRLVAGVAGGAVPGPAGGPDAASPAAGDGAAARSDGAAAASAGDKPWHIVPLSGADDADAAVGGAAAAAAPPGFIERLLTRFLDNLMVRIARLHVRLEDRHSVPGHPFAAGVTAWQTVFTAATPRFVPLESPQPSGQSGLGGMVFKLVRIGSTSVYVNPHLFLCRPGGEAIDMSAAPPDVVAHVEREWMRAVSKRRHESDFASTLGPRVQRVRDAWPHLAPVTTKELAAVRERLLGGIERMRKQAMDALRVAADGASAGGAPGSGTERSGAAHSVQPDVLVWLGCLGADDPADALRLVDDAARIARTSMVPAAFDLVLGAVDLERCGLAEFVGILGQGINEPGTVVPIHPHAGAAAAADATWCMPGAGHTRTVSATSASSALGAGPERDDLDGLPLHGADLLVPRAAPTGPPRTQYVIEPTDVSVRCWYVALHKRRLAGRADPPPDFVASVAPDKGLAEGSLGSFRDADVLGSVLAAGDDDDLDAATAGAGDAADGSSAAGLSGSDKRPQRGRRAGKGFLESGRVPRGDGHRGRRGQKSRRRSRRTLAHGSASAASSDDASGALAFETVTDAEDRDAVRRASSHRTRRHRLQASGAATGPRQRGLLVSAGDESLVGGNESDQESDLQQGSRLASRSPSEAPSGRRRRLRALPPEQRARAEEYVLRRRMWPRGAPRRLYGEPSGIESATDLPGMLRVVCGEAPNRWLGWARRFKVCTSQLAELPDTDDEDEELAPEDRADARARQQLWAEFDALMSEPAFAQQRIEGATKPLAPAPPSVCGAPAAVQDATVIVAPAARPQLNRLELAAIGRLDAAIPTSVLALWRLQAEAELRRDEAISAMHAQGLSLSPLLGAATPGTTLQGLAGLGAAPGDASTGDAAPGRGATAASAAAGAAAAAQQAAATEGGEQSTSETSDPSARDSPSGARRGAARAGESPAEARMRRARHLGRQAASSKTPVYGGGVAAGKQSHQHAHGRGGAEEPLTVSTVVTSVFGYLFGSGGAASGAASGPSTADADGDGVPAALSAPGSLGTADGRAGRGQRGAGSLSSESSLPLASGPNAPLSQVQRQTLYGAVDFQPADIPRAYPPGYTQMVLALRLGTLVVDFIDDIFEQHSEPPSGGERDRAAAWAASGQRRRRASGAGGAGPNSGPAVPADGAESDLSSTTALALVPPHAHKPFVGLRFRGVFARLALRPSSARVELAVASIGAGAGAAVNVARPFRQLLQPLPDSRAPGWYLRQQQRERQLARAAAAKRRAMVAGLPIAAPGAPRGVAGRAAAAGSEGAGGAGSVAGDPDVPAFGAGSEDGDDEDEHDGAFRHASMEDPSASQGAFGPPLALVPLSAAVAAGPAGLTLAGRSRLAAQAMAAHTSAPGAIAGAMEAVRHSAGAVEAPAPWEGAGAAGSSSSSFFEGAFVSALSTLAGLTGLGAGGAAAAGGVTEDEAGMSGADPYESDRNRSGGHAHPWRLSSGGNAAGGAGYPGSGGASPAGSPFLGRQALGAGALAVAAVADEDPTCGGRFPDDPTVSLNRTVYDHCLLFVALEAFPVAAQEADGSSDEEPEASGGAGAASAGGQHEGGSLPRPGHREPGRRSSLMESGVLGGPDWLEQAAVRLSVSAPTIVLPSDETSAMSLLAAVQLGKLEAASPLVRALAPSRGNVTPAPMSPTGGEPRAPSFG
ncbi:hypothetical protein FNF27_05357 [Cafeteria roenbergensis]|uniref:Chorein N-terminal domain-containing protein n=1 Tax=Cafeteria roenbergensis TaxID=33653 RepID=A0A5A8E5S2_CAFRO|nr:hypothetical protein FNF27_05357 [Cafeteria roenbergensis]